jgi:hypothetical protein
VAAGQLEKLEKLTLFENPIFFVTHEKRLSQQHGQAQARTKKKKKKKRDHGSPPRADRDEIVPPPTKRHDYRVRIIATVPWLKQLVCSPYCTAPDISSASEAAAVASDHSGHCSAR